MSLMEETDKRFLYLSKKIFLFVIIAVLGVIGIIVFIGIHKDYFTKKAFIYFISENGHGLTEGQPVKISGFKIGKIERISLDDVAKVKVEISINKKYIKWIKTDSVIRYVKEGFIGDTFLEVTPGSAQAKQIEDGGYLNFQGAKGINEIIDELKNDIKPALLDIKQIIHYINDPKGDVKQILSNMNKLSYDLQHTRELMDTVLKNTDKQIENTLKNTDILLGSVKNTIDTTQIILKNMETRLPDMLDKIDKSLTNVQKITDDLKNTTQDTPELINRVTDITEDTKDITDAVKKIWPISSKIKAPQEKTLKIDSYE